MVAGARNGTNSIEVPNAAGQREWDGHPSRDQGAQVPRPILLQIAATMIRRMDGLRR